MPVVYDKFGRTWKGRKVVWIRSANCARLALYRWGRDKDGNRKLIYDRKRGMYDEDGYHIKETRIEIVPALEGRGEDGKPVEGTWERFPDTDEAWSFKKSITPTGYKTQVDVSDANDFDNEFDEEILIK